MSKIEWTDVTWNPVTGCTKVSEGCRFCFAEREWKRLSANPKYVAYGRKFTEVQCHEERLLQPLKWKKPLKIFVNSMSDLFHPDVPFSFILKVYAVMVLCRQHTFIILTKRPERMLEYYNHEIHQSDIDAFEFIPENMRRTLFLDLPFKNIWIGTSCEDQKTLNARAPVISKIPAAVRLISLEPLLGPINLENTNQNIGWVICGGESGPHARPMNPLWVKSIRNQCIVWDIQFFFKQWGEFITAEMCPPEVDFEKSRIYMDDPDGRRYFHVGKKKAGRLLDGWEWNEFPKETQGIASLREGE